MNKKLGIRLAIFLTIAAISTIVDLATKEWAKNSLARSDHALALHASSSDAGKSLSEFVKSGPMPDVEPRRVVKLGESLQAKGEDLFPVEFITSHAGYWVFLEEDRVDPPVFIPNPALKAYSEKKAEGFSFPEWKKEWVASGVTWGQVLAEGIPFLDAEETLELLAAGQVHPVPIRMPQGKSEAVVASGDIYLVTLREIEVIPGFFRFIYAENPGAAWGIMRDAPLLVRKIFLQLVSVLAMLVLLYVAYKAPEDQYASMVALALIFGGALGNFVDRIGRNYVVDFIDMYVKTSHWPTYNVADITISVGVGIIAIQVMRKKSPF